MVVRNNARGTKSRAKATKNISDEQKYVNENHSNKSEFENEVDSDMEDSNSIQSYSESGQDCDSSDIEQSSAFNKQFYVAPKKRGSSGKPDVAASENMWRYYPKQVQSILKKKRIDRERLRRSLKPPGKRNYKHLFANLQKVWKDEVSKASTMFKDLKDVFYKLTHAERQIRKALLEKGLYLDQKDFDIMAVFNQETSDSYYNSSQVDEDEWTEKEFENIYADDFDSTSAKLKLETEKRIKQDIDRLSIHSHHNVKVPIIQSCTPEIPSLSKGSSPNSNIFDYKSHISRVTDHSQLSFIPKNSGRALFPEFKAERRWEMESSQNQHKHYICTWNCENKLQYMPFVYLEHNFRHGLESSDDHSILDKTDLLRSISMPIPDPREVEDKLLQPLSLERQPFSSMINLGRSHHNYLHPLFKTDLKQSTKHVNKYESPRFRENPLGEIWNGLMDEYENIPL